MGRIKNKGPEMAVQKNQMGEICEGERYRVD
jgi:hypothetical protein